MGGWACTLKLGITSKAQEYFSLYNELAKDKDKALGAYYQALYHTVIGDLQKALDFLEEAIAKGYTNRYIYSGGTPSPLA